MGMTLEMMLGTYTVTHIINSMIMTLKLHEGRMSGLEQRDRTLTSL